jgi:hypothetical protein
MPDILLPFASCDENVTKGYDKKDFGRTCGRNSFSLPSGRPTEISFPMDVVCEIIEIRTPYINLPNDGCPLMMMLPKESLWGVQSQQKSTALKQIIPFSSAPFPDDEFFVLHLLSIVSAFHPAIIMECDKRHTKERHNGPFPYTQNQFLYYYLFLPSTRVVLFLPSTRVAL